MWRWEWKPDVQMAELRRLISERMPGAKVLGTLKRRLEGYPGIEVYGYPVRMAAVLERGEAHLVYLDGNYRLRKMAENRSYKVRMSAGVADFRGPYLYANEAEWYLATVLPEVMPGYIQYATTEGEVV